MNVYTSDILSAVITFPFIAALITLPYLIHQYRKFGSVPWMHTLVVYSFVFYLLCAYFLVLLPLPADHTAVVPYAQTPQLEPFNFVRGIIATANISLTDPLTWLTALRNSYVYEALFNMLLTVPLGMYLRYYFRRTWWHVLLIGFCVTLSFETLQLTGLLGIYEHPYRLFDVDDLIVNTTGAMVGFWAVGPLLRVLPDIRLINEEAREAGGRASATRRAVSFGIDLAMVAVVAVVVCTILFITNFMNIDARSNAFQLTLCLSVATVAYAVLLCGIPLITRGRTLGQMLLRLRIVRPDATPARWYQCVGRYAALYALAAAPSAVLLGLLTLDTARGADEIGTLASFVVGHRTVLIVIWAVIMGIWLITLLVRAARSAAEGKQFIMLNGLLSNTRVMTEVGIEEERERRAVLSVDEVRQLEERIAADGTPLSMLMEHAGCAVAEAVQLRVPDPKPVVVLAGSGNNGGDGWVAARALAQAGYPTTLIAPDLAENLHAEPARTVAQEVFAQAAETSLPLRVLIAPDADILAQALDGASAMVDAILGTGFTGSKVREPYASWIEAANRRRFEGTRGHGRGQHRKRTHARGHHEVSLREHLPVRVKDAPFAVSVDVPSGFDAQAGTVAEPCFAADVTVTMLTYKPGLITDGARAWCGITRLAPLVDTRPYLEQLHCSTEN